MCIFVYLGFSLCWLLNWTSKTPPPPHKRWLSPQKGRRKHGGEWGKGRRGDFVDPWLPLLLHPHPPSPLPHPKNLLILIHIAPNPCPLQAHPPKKITTLGYQLIKLSRRPLPGKKTQNKTWKDNKGEVLRPNQRTEINTVPRDLLLSHCHPPQ